VSVGGGGDRDQQLEIGLLDVKGFQSGTGHVPQQGES